MDDKKPVIYADKREAGSRILHILRERCELREKQLNVADYLLSRRVAVERKTAGDFLSSMVDGRLFKQMEELKSNFKRPLLILEGKPLATDRKIHPNAIRGALASISLDYSVPIITTESNLDTAEMLISIAKREQFKARKSFNVRGSKKAKSMNHRQEFLLSGLPKVNTVIARKLLKHFGSPEKIFLANEGQLQNVDGIGPQMARRIRQILSKKYEKSVLED